MANLYFPFEKVRPIQKRLMSEVHKAVINGNHLVVHAPTGIGKTAAVISPALKYALDNKKRVFFLTSRHTQHRIVIETVKKLSKRHSLQIKAVDIIGKQWMCAQEVANKLSSADFYEYCKAIRKENQCSYFSNLKLSRELSTFPELNDIMHAEKLIAECKARGVCPYEVARMMAKQAKLVVVDYGYLFDPYISTAFLAKLGIPLENIIIVIDEAHNLPKRLIELMSYSLSSYLLKQAIKELNGLGLDELAKQLKQISNAIPELRIEDEAKLKMDDFVALVNMFSDYNTLTERLELVADRVVEEREHSWCGSVARFMESWLGKDEGFVRVLKKHDNRFQIVYRCLDPALVSSEIIKSSHSTIAMSGTLTPTEMFKDLLGFPKSTLLKEYESPFPKENRLSLIVPVTSTRYSTRSKEEYKRIALVAGKIADAIHGNVAVFFPSYELRDSISKHISDWTDKILLFEQRKMSKQAKQELIERFVANRKHGALLLGVVRGSFGEGIDLPGDMLNGVIVVGLPLSVPDIETQALIDYYEKKFSRGLDYGYIYPAIRLALQSAGRCIRSEKDKGVVVFLDERYAYPRYRKCFPADWHFVITKDPVPFIDDFFGA